MTAPAASLLSSGQIAKRVFDESIGAVRTIPASSTDFAIELSADDGDSVLSRNDQVASQEAITSASTGVVIAAASCVGYSEVALYTNTTSTIVGAQICTVQVSPSDTDDVWVDTAATITPSLTSGVSVYTAPVSIAARRIRVSIASAITSGTFTLYMIVRS